MDWLLYDNGLRHERVKYDRLLIAWYLKFVTNHYDFPEYD